MTFDAPTPVAELSRDKHRRRDLLIALTIFLLALFIRLPLAAESCWCDELASLKGYVYVPVTKTIAGKTYYPNNHVLHSLLAKLSLSTAKALHFIPRPRPTTNPPPLHPIGTGSASFSETAFRLPAMLAGSLVGLVLAWPLRRAQPLAALLIALILAFQPWLIAFSTEARGYTLVLLLVALATHLLPSRNRPVAWGYAITIALALYTVPICLTIIAAHGAAMLFLRRNLFACWLRSACVAGLLAALLYAPLFGPMRKYYKEANDPTITYSEFLQQLPGYLHAGHNVPDVLSLLLPLAVLIAGVYLAWKQNILRPAVATFTIASILGLFAPLLSHAAGEVRFVPWLILLYATALTAIFIALWQRRPLRIAAVALLALFLLNASLQYRYMLHVPDQPIRNGMDLIGKTAPPNAHVIVLYMGAPEAVYAYGDLVPQTVDYAFKVSQLQEKEQAGPGPVWVMVLYEKFMLRDDPDVWDYLQQHYTRRTTLPGRISPLDLYERTR